MMYAIEFLPGTHITAAAAALVEAAAVHGSATGKFNDIELVADDARTADEIVAFWNAETERRAEEYRNSPEGKRAAKETDGRRAAARQKHDSLMQQLPRLDMHDEHAVLDWLCEMQEPSDHAGVIVRRLTIVDAFEKAGYKAGENCSADYREGDRGNMHRYLVGQALSGLKDGPSIHPLLHKFADEWRCRFPRTHPTP